MKTKKELRRTICVECIRQILERHWVEIPDSYGLKVKEFYVPDVGSRKLCSKHRLLATPLPGTPL